MFLHMMTMVVRSRITYNKLKVLGSVLPHSYLLVEQFLSLSVVQPHPPLQLSSPVLQQELLFHTAFTPRSLPLSRNDFPNYSDTRFLNSITRELRLMATTMSQTVTFTLQLGKANLSLPLVGGSLQV